MVSNPWLKSLGHLDHADGVDDRGVPPITIPGLLADVDRLVYGVAGQQVDPLQLIEANGRACGPPHGGRPAGLSHVTRHMVGLFHGQPGARPLPADTVDRCDPARAGPGGAVEGLCGDRATAWRKTPPDWPIYTSG